MIVCPNCNHQNPDGATQCEACYTPLPSTTSCPNCGASVQTDASFCGQCGFNLKVSTATAAETMPSPNPLPDVPDLVNPDPLIEPEPISYRSQSSMPEPQTNPTELPTPDPASPLLATVVSQPGEPEAENTTPPDPDPVTEVPEATSSPSAPPPAAATGSAKTQLQVQSAHLLHLQTDNKIELSSHLSVIHLGKPNDRIPPDIDVSGFPNSDIVSRIHADIRVEGDAFYIEDVGSANGTYINHTPLPPGNRHRLRMGDRIGLGKGDLVTFIFQSS